VLLRHARHARRAQRGADIREAIDRVPFGAHRPRHRGEARILEIGADEAVALEGWTVQVLEQIENNILIRPLTVYSGPEARDYVPIANR